MNGGDDDDDDALGAFAPFLTRVLSWDYYKIYAESMSACGAASKKANGKTQSSSSSSSSSALALKPIPLRFSNAREYVQCFSSFLLEEAKAIVLKGDGNGAANVACEKCARVSVLSSRDTNNAAAATKTKKSSPTSTNRSGKNNDDENENENENENDFDEQKKKQFLYAAVVSFETPQQCEQFNENDLLFLSKLSSLSEDEKIEKGVDYCFAFCEGRVSDTALKMRLFSPLKPGNAAGTTTTNGQKKRSGGQQQQHQSASNDALNEDDERLVNIRAKLLGNNHSWHLTRVCNMSTVRREWLAVQEVSSIPFADLILDASINNNNTRNTNVAKKQKKEQQQQQLQKQQRQYQPSWEIPKDLSDAMKARARSDQSQLEIATTTALTKENPLVLIQGPPGTGKTTTIISLLSVILAAQPINRNHVADSGDDFIKKKSALSEEEKLAIKMKAQPWLFGITNPRDCSPIIDLGDTSDEDEENNGNKNSANIENQRRGHTSPSSTIPIELMGPSISKRSKILVCAPSNSAVDEIVRRLLRKELLDEHGKPYKPSIVRVGGNFHRDVAHVSLERLIEERIKQDYGREHFSSGGGKDEKGLKTFGSFQDNRRFRQIVLDEAKVVCTTLSAVGSEIFRRMKTRFDVVIVDEAAQAVEPSTLIPLTEIKAKQVYLVGDPAQLPATVLSRECAKNNYEQSLFKRLMDSEYPVHKLSTQYRMLPEIREFPSEQFYGGELRDGPGLLKQNYRDWHECKLYRPFVFYDVQHGKEESSSSGFSWVNEEEAAFAVELAHQLLKANPILKRGGPKVAIISPYRAQVSMIRRKLEKKFGGMHNYGHNVEVLSIDNSQGSEKEVVIFSLVRAPVNDMFQVPKKTSASNNANIKSRRNLLGFVADERRINVGLTRAKCSMLVLGNAKAMKTDPNWGALVESARRRDCTISVPHRGQFRSFFSDYAQYHDSDLSGSEDDTDDGASSLKSMLYEDDYGVFEDTDKDISPDKLTIDRAAETDGYAKYGFKDDLVFEQANKADVVGGEEDGAFADDDDANVDAFVQVNESAPVGKKASASAPKKEKAKTEEKKKPATKKRAAPASKAPASAATKRSRK